jgi:hypothetical protein
MEWMAWAGRMVLAKRRMAAAKRWAGVTKRLGGARSAVKVVPLDLEAVQSGAQVAILGRGAILPAA